MTFFDPYKVRRDFPILQSQMNGKPLVYLDNGASTQKPQKVIDAISSYYANLNANVHRGVYRLSQQATEAFEEARRRVAKFINAPEARSCIFTRGATEAINLVASSWGGANLQAGDEVLISALEHHSNIVPWQMICQATGAKLRVLPVTEKGELDLSQLTALLTSATKLVAIQDVSNALGTWHDLDPIIERARKVGAKILIDAAQSIGHHPTNVQQLDVDFLAFSGHKLFGPTGIGVLWGQADLLESMQPYQGGGDMIESVSFEQTTYAQIPNRFEAGTPHIAGAIGLAAAIDYIEGFDFREIFRHEQKLLEVATQRLERIDGLRIIGTAANKAAVISFVIDDMALLDVGMALDRDGIAVRTGHHCCMPLMNCLGISGTTRASFALYNTTEDVQALGESLQRIVAEHRAQSATQVRGQSSDIQFAKATADSPSAAADQLAEEFLLFEDRESKTELLLDLARALPRTFDHLKPLCSPVPGCMSEVYLIGRPMPDSPSKFEFLADSNAEIVRGLIAVLQSLFSGQDAQQLLEFDIESFFNRIGLNEFISTQRRSGLNGMIRNIRTLASSIVERRYR